jgi:peptide/nickel transport system substrate-binding protein
MRVMMKLPPRRRAVAAFLAAIVVAASNAAGAGEAGVALHAWTRPDVLRYGDQIEPDSLNPYLSNALAAGRVEQMIYSGLLRYGPGGKLYPDLATTVPSVGNGGISRDGTTYTYHLDPRALWHDGVPVTAADVVFTWHAIMDPSHNVTSRASFDQIASVVALDAHTVRIAYKGPYAAGLGAFTGGPRHSILPKHALEHVDFNTAGFNQAPIGSGPYVFVKWNRGSDVQLAAFPRYFRGVASIPKIDFRILPDTNTLFNAVRTHDVDAAEIDANFVALARQTDGIHVVSGATLSFRHIDYNTASPILSDRNVRLALSYAIDRDAIYDKIYFGIGERNPGDQLVSFGWGDPRLRRYPHDPERANALLDRAGWRRGPDGIRVKAGRRFEITIRAIAGQKPAEATEVELQSDWAKIGVDLIVKNSPGTTLFANGTGPLSAGDFDVSYYAFQREADPDDIDTIGPFSVPPRGRNWTRFADPELGRLQLQALRALDPARRHALYDQIQRLLVANDPFDTIYWVPSIIGHNVDLHGVHPIPGATIFWNVAQWRFGPTS